MRIVAYKLSGGVKTHLKLPKNAEILTVGSENGILKLFVLENLTEEFKLRTFECVETNYKLNSKAKYINSTQHNGRYVHVFEELKD